MEAPKKTNVIHATTASFDKDVLRSSTPVVVDFYADWCGPCKMLAPQLEKLAAEFAGKVKVVKVNVDDENDLAVQYGISGIPTLVFFRDGRPEDTVVGLVPAGTLEEKVKSLAGAGAGAKG
jgi:thioredoxin 1